MTLHVTEGLTSIIGFVEPHSLGVGAVYICFVSMSSISERVDQA